MITAIGDTICPGFVVDGNNSSEMKALIAYFHNDPKGALNPGKGLFMRGSVGTGKTLILRCFCEYTRIIKSNWFAMSTAREVKRRYSTGGFEAIDKYGYNHKTEGHVSKNSPWNYCFDDLGTEGTLTKHYGENANIMAELFQDRYEVFTHYGKLTHITTNLTPPQFEEFYGDRILSRLKEMCNDIVLTGKDRRK